MRGCIGEPTAWMEGVMVLASIVQNWDMRQVTDRPVVLLPRNFFLRPKNGIWLELAKRTNL